MAMFNSYVSLPEGSWFYMHWELAILRYCGDILSMFETQDFKAKSQNIEGIELSNLTQQLPCRMGWRFAGRRRNAQISEVLTWHLALPSSGGRPGGWDCMIRFLAANLPFFGWHFLFSRGVSKIASEFDVLFGHECVLKKTQITHLKASLRSHKDIWGELRSARFRYSKYCRISTLLCFTPASWDQITDRDNKTHQPFGTRDSPKTLSLVTLNYRL